jgi:hypothetical protein
MDYYKSIDWHSVPIDEILSIITINNQHREQVVPLTKETEIKVLELLNVNMPKIDMWKIMLVYFPPNKRVSIHSDKPKETNDPGKLHRCIFLPLKNCQNLIWHWYEAIDSSKIFYYGEPENWKKVPMIQYDNARILNTTDCKHPFISDIGTFHALQNLSNEPAIGLSIRLMPWAWDTIDTDPILPPVSGIALK